MRIAFAIFALWVLVVEPTFRAFERLEQNSSQCSGGEAVADADQLLPPGHVVAPRWINEHHPLAMALPLPDLTSRAWLVQPTVFPAAPTALSAELSLPYPPSALPLRS